MVERVLSPNHQGERNVLHVAFVPAIRGRKAILMANKWLALYLSYYKILQGDVPKKWPQALRFSKWMNFQPVGETRDYIITEIRE